MAAYVFCRRCFVKKLFDILYEINQESTKLEVAALGKATESKEFHEPRIAAQWIEFRLCAKPQQPNVAFSLASLLSVRSSFVA